jgi:hypothetical protein
VHHELATGKTGADSARKSVGRKTKSHPVTGASIARRPNVARGAAALARSVNGWSGSIGLRAIIPKPHRGVVTGCSSSGIDSVRQSGGERSVVLWREEMSTHSIPCSDESYASKATGRHESTWCLLLRSVIAWPSLVGRREPSLGLAPEVVGSNPIAIASGALARPALDAKTNSSCTELSRVASDDGGKTPRSGATGIQPSENDGNGIAGQTVHCMATTRVVTAGETAKLSGLKSGELVQ